jgi:hypothetical protein
LFLCAGGVKGVEIHTGLSAQYGDNALPRRSVHEWIDMFKKARTGVIDSERSWCQSKLTSEAKQQQARVMIPKDSKAVFTLTWYHV